MEELRNALTALEEAVSRLELTVHQAKKNYAQASGKTEELKGVLSTVYDRIDKMITDFKGAE